MSGWTIDFAHERDRWAWKRITLVARLTPEQERCVREGDGCGYGMLIKNLHLAGEVPDGYLPLSDSVRPLH